MSAAWLPEGRSAAVCISLDDVHPGRSTDDYEAGGDLSDGVLGRLERVLDAHPAARATLFVTPDWRERSPVPTRRQLARVPVVRDHLHLTPPRRRAALRLDRHPEFVAHVRERPCFDVAAHGLTHLARGRHPPRELDGLGARGAERRVRHARALFQRAGFETPRGFSPPGWGLPPSLQTGLVRAGFAWVSSARDLGTAVTPQARAAGSGLTGVRLVAPERIAGGALVHLPVNFQATSADERAFAIVEAGGLLSIKAHAVKDAFGFVALDVLDDAYCDRLQRLLVALDERYGDALWWTTMDDVAARV